METNTKIPNSSEENPNNQAAPNASPEEKQNDYLFFNVMPKGGAGAGKIVEPTIKIQQEGVLPPGENKAMSFFKKNKVYLIMALVVIIGGPILYFAIPKIFGDPYKNSSVLINQDTLLKSQGKKQADSQTAAPVAITKEWLLKYFNTDTCNTPTICGDSADPDLDGLTNLEEFKLGTDPNNKDSDQDGIADGDEIHVFLTNPLNSHTAGITKYSDADNLKGGFKSVNPGVKFTAEEFAGIKERIKKYGLHQPTITTLGDILNKLYGFDQQALTVPTPATASSTPANASSTNSSTLDQSPGARQDRDAQRSSTIKTFGIALVKYQVDNRSFPATIDFPTMYSQIRMYLRVATNPTDPINQIPFIYSYAPNSKGDDFTLSYFSEVANQIIKKHYADALKDKAAEEANNFDNQRKTDLETMQNALLLYSDKNVAGGQTQVFPTVDKYKSDLVPTYISAIPVDPKTHLDYQYLVSDKFDTFTLKAVFDNPSPGTTGYLCNQDSCQNY